MKTPPRVPRVRDYVQMLLGGWFILVLATAGSAGIGWVSWQTAKPVYQSTSAVFITSPGAAPISARRGPMRRARSTAPSPTRFARTAVS